MKAEIVIRCSTDEHKYLEAVNDAWEEATTIGQAIDLGVMRFIARHPEAVIHSVEWRGVL